MLYGANGYPVTVEQIRELKGVELDARLGGLPVRGILVKEGDVPGFLVTNATDRSMLMNVFRLGYNISLGE
jgi:hypothetical protein